MVLCSRLRRVLDETSSFLPNAFIDGRQIWDVALVANEVVYIQGRNKVSRIFCAS